ncbi:MAG: ABC transporter permease [Candidatus Saganbacteria bacterium]|nr:ABC transporter permease [Candidatus Saganbacteria bacterium]
MKRRIWQIFKKEFIHIVRDPRTLALALLLPVLLLLLFGYAVSFDVKHLSTAVYDQDQSPQSREFLGNFTNSEYFDYNYFIGSEREMGRLLDEGKVKVVINIPRRFGEKIKEMKTAPVQVIVDGSDPNMANSALVYINTITDKYSRDLLYEKFNYKLNFEIIPRFWYNPDQKSVDFYIPGLIAMILMMLAASLTSVSIVGERERGSMEGLLVTPLKPYELMIGKLLPYVFVALIDVTLVTVIGCGWFGVPLKGSLTFLYVSSFMFLSGALGLGLLISTIAKSQEEAMMLALILTMLPTQLLSGFIFPINSMPVFLQGITFFVPARYFIVIMRGIFLKGVGITSLWWDFSLLIGFALLMILLSSRRFSKRL